MSSGGGGGGAGGGGGGFRRDDRVKSDRGGARSFSNQDRNVSPGSCCTRSLLSPYPRPGQWWDFHFGEFFLPFAHWFR